jgi:S-adenosylmethionine:tRNA ribosyltransferase-isomerase
VNVSDFDFVLPAESIAQRPSPRGTSRLLVLDRTSGAVAHHSFGELPGFLKEGDVLVVNDTRVIPARLFGTDARGRRTEFLLVKRTGPSRWECLAKPGRRARPGAAFAFGEGLRGVVGAKTSSGRYLVDFSGAPLEDVLPRVGSAPLPPYIHRPLGLADARDAVDYQTVYSNEPGAIAAPTAGLHFTEELLEDISRSGVSVNRVTLHVGLGTFRPVKCERVEDHVMDKEGGTIPEETARAVNLARREGHRVIAVGTTSVRTLESSAAAHDGLVAAGPFETDLFLTPGAPFRVVDALLTNFHLPRSTLLMLVSAFAGREKVLTAYGEAVRLGYRFFSYGDAMFIV